MRPMIGLVASTVLVLLGCRSAAPSRSASTVPATRTVEAPPPDAVTPRKGTVAIKALPRDPRAEEQFTLGERYLKQRNYTEAARAFAAAAARTPTHRVTTASLYLLGLSYQEAGQTEKALDAYQTLIRRFPDSRYVDDAQYHKGLILLAKPGQEAAGLYLLLTLAETSLSSPMQADADAAARNFLFRQASLGFLQDYATKARQSYRDDVVEALVLQARAAGQTAQADRAIKQYLDDGGESTARIRQLQGNRSSSTTATRAPSGGRNLRVAVLLPFQSAKVDSLRDIQAQMSTDLLAGMQHALTAERFPGIANVELKVWDTNGDSATIARSLSSQLASFRPDVVIGDIRNRPSRAIANLAVQQNFTHIVPLSDTDELVNAGGNTFLVNPTEVTTAKGLAGYVKDRVRPRKVMVLDDGTSSSHDRAVAFEQTLKQPGTEVRRWPVSPKGQLAIQDITQMMKELQSDRFDAIFAPLSDESSVQWLMHKLFKDSINVQVYGTDQWRAYRRADRDLYRKFKVLITDAYQPINDTLSAATFTDGFTRTYKAPPREFAIQGYDLMRMLLEAWGRNPEAATLGDALLRARPFRGIAQDFRFQGGRSNQSVQILQYQENELARLEAR